MLQVPDWPPFQPPPPPLPPPPHAPAPQSPPLPPTSPPPPLEAARHVLPRLLPSSDEAGTSTIVLCDLIDMKHASSSSDEWITLQILSSEADAIFSTSHVARDKFPTLSLINGNTRLRGHAAELQATLCDVMVLVAVDCPDAYARLSLDVSSDNPASISSLSVVGDHRYERLPISEFLGFIRIPFSFFVANPVRVVLRGRVSHVDDRLQPECAIEREMSINVNAMLTYRVTKPALAAWSQARSVVCSPSFMTNVLNENSEFEVEVSAPKEIGAIFSVNMTYSGTSDASPLLTVRKAIEVIVDKPRSYPVDRRQYSRWSQSKCFQLYHHDGDWMLRPHLAERWSACKQRIKT